MKKNHRRNCADKNERYEYFLLCIPASSRTRGKEIYLEWKKSEMRKSEEKSLKIT